MRVVFLGTPEFAVPTLRRLAERFEVVGVITQPDRPAGRGRRPQAPPVKTSALVLHLDLHQTERIRSAESLAVLQAWQPDVIVVAAFGQILPPSVLSLAPSGCLNVHASLLPRWRGASPVQHALLHGDDRTGVTIMKMDEGLDTGPVLAQRAVAIRPDHTGGSLTALLADIGADLLVETLPSHAAGDLTPQLQDDRLATLAPRLRSSDGALDPQLPATHLERQIRAFSPWPGSRLRWGEDTLRILASHVVAGPASPPGTIVAPDGFPAMAAGQGYLALDEVQLPGGRPTPGAAFLAGHRTLIGAVLTKPE
jgi:methionyl-tRNA formyltransferase